MYNLGDYEDAAYGVAYGDAFGDGWAGSQYGQIMIPGPQLAEDEAEYGVVGTLILASVLASPFAYGGAALGVGTLAAIARRGGPKHLQALATRKRRLKAKLKKVKAKWRKKRLRKRIKRIEKTYQKLKARLKRKISRRKSKGKKLTKRQQRSLAIVQREQRRRKRAKARKAAKAAAAGGAVSLALKKKGSWRIRRMKKHRAYDVKAFVIYSSLRKRGYGHIPAMMRAAKVFPAYYKNEGMAKLSARIKQSGPWTFHASPATIGPSPFQTGPMTQYPEWKPSVQAQGQLPAYQPPAVRQPDGSFQFPPQSVSAKQYGPGGGQYPQQEEMMEEGFSEEAESGPEDEGYSDEGDDYGEETPFWKKPIFLGGAAVVAFLGYQQMQKGKKSPKNGKSKKKAS